MRAWQAIAIASLLSALIEIAQLATRLGMLDVDDWLFKHHGPRRWGTGCIGARNAVAAANRSHETTNPAAIRPLLKHITIHNRRNDSYAVKPSAH